MAVRPKPRRFPPVLAADAQAEPSPDVSAPALANAAPFEDLRVHAVNPNPKSIGSLKSNPLKNEFR
ncbi:hypothetical protein [Bradyrhizobium japonicum]|uniref:hypothetical protein n=1 Tax=Bradyrhizobium japonicum TaxID=375 RepID=UPI00209CA54A|nr:hypothetical protein [Bradyrhizobium japonicum]MCP1761156.1 hypothetical protein [Bradyrhizobium japonicum]MCP1792735.1 hypothetical protein [Bradyrhizobium japonicum]MCP1805170.1 hypothetical protein [Bradyrhizobium japonicum]MCP1814187.1 hypothetical protein [Bradyrhizobium japonicum]MCP1874384.1 hypothetical protein [Bradyrhizobium japonicum]